MNRTFLGFGFGPIQGGLFLFEAFRSGIFNRFVVAEVAPAVVDAIRRAGGRYRVNVATATGIAVHEIGPIEIFNPLVGADRERLVAAVSQADEIATALPSVKFYGAGEPGSVVDILAAGLKKRPAGARRRCIIYAAENHNQAAEILEAGVARRAGSDAPDLKTYCQYLNTVIGKMSGTVTDEALIAEQKLARLAGDSGHCFLVEAFNRILISRIVWPDFKRGIRVFEEKENLLPFEEAKLYGHNATHALIGFLARLKGRKFMADVRADRDLLELARAAFIEESGRALCRKHQGVDSLFTAKGYAAYANDLLERMLNPYLRDAVERVVRDPRRKLGWDDRLVGVMRLALANGIRPARYALGAAAALRMLQETENISAEAVLEAVWKEACPAAAEQKQVRQLIAEAGDELKRWFP